MRTIHTVQRLYKQSLRHIKNVLTSVPLKCEAQLTLESISCNLEFLVEISVQEIIRIRVSYYGDIIHMDT